MKPSTKQVLFRVACLLIWVLGGAWIFKLVEEKEDRSVEDKMKELYRSKSSKLNMTFAEFENISAAITKVSGVSRRRPWTYKNAVEFAFHTVTTIGYGYITPTTPIGQILCVLYALIGIPISMLALKSVGSLIAAGFTVIICKVEKRLWKTSEPKHVEIKCTVVTIVTTIVFLIITIVIQVHVERLTYIEGTYLWVISFTTVGYGDYYPGKNIDLNLHESYIVFVEIFGILFYIMGLCFVSSVLNSIASAIEKRRCCGKCPGCTCIPRKLQTNKYRPDSVETPNEELEMEGAKRLDGGSKDNKSGIEREPRRSSSHVIITMSDSKRNSKRNSKHCDESFDEQKPSDKIEAIGISILGTD